MYPNLTKNLFFFFFFFWRGGGGLKEVGGISVRACTNVSNGNFTLQGEHLCKLILKSMHICRSYGPQKLIYVTFKCDLDLQPALKMIQMALLLPKDNNCVK